MDNVGQKISDNFSLDKLTMTFEKGKKYAIVGKSGSGKSSIIKLLTEYGPDYTGRVLIDGHELSGLNKESIMHVSPVCYQQTYIFSDTVFNNVTLYQDYPPAIVLQGVKTKFIILVIATISPTVILPAATKNIQLPKTFTTDIGIILNDGVNNVYGMIMQFVFAVVAVIYLLCVEPFVLLIVAAVSFVQFAVPNILKKKIASSRKEYTEALEVYLDGIKSDPDFLTDIIQTDFLYILFNIFFIIVFTVLFQQSFQFSFYLLHCS